MEIKQRIDRFNRDNPPFYIVNHDDGTFSLCLPLDFLCGEYRLYCQDAFDAYAAEIGEPACDEYGLYNHGSGYEWEAAFREAFKDDPGIDKISFDCEMGGFFCYANDLSLIEDFGRRFKKICEDTERFTPIVSQGIKTAEAQREEYERLMGTVRGQLMKNPSVDFEIMTPDGNIRITPEDGKALLDIDTEVVRIGNTIVSTQELLDQEVADMQRDLFDPNLIRLKTEVPEEAMTMSM